MRLFWKTVMALLRSYTIINFPQMQVFLPKKFVKYSLCFYNIAMLYLNKNISTDEFIVTAQVSLLLKDRD